MIIDLSGQYALSLQSAGSFSPADATTYYWGNLAIAPTTTQGNRRIYIPQAGRIIAYTGVFFPAVVGSAENSTLNIRLNATTDTAVSSTIDLSANFSITNTSLSIAVAAGDFIEMKWVTPTWATNPTTVLMTGVILIAR